MGKKRVCKRCKIFVDGSDCPICKGKSFSTNWQGRVHIIDVKKSFIAKNMGLTKEGEYCIKVK